MRPAAQSMALNSACAYDFVEQPPQVFFCPVSFAVLLEPYQTRCCGNHLSKDTYQRLQGKPCPVCRQENFTAMNDKFHKKNVLTLKVRCPHKAEGCEWEGELGSLEQHLNTNSSAGECRYVDVDCPYACGERVQRRNVEEHKSQHCPLRPFTCQYCNHEATHQKVTIEHWPVCEKYPLPCPNECGDEIERQHLEGHLEQICPLKVIECEFSYAGCGAELQRRIMSAHMKEGKEAHLSFVAQVNKKVPKLENVMQQQADKIKQKEDQNKQQADQIKQKGDQIKKQGDLIKQQGDQIKQQGFQIKQQGEQIKQQGFQTKQDRDQMRQQREQIQQQGDQIKRQENLISALMTKLQVGMDIIKTPPVDIVMEDFEEHKKLGNAWHSPPFYSHVGGYKMCLTIFANGNGIGKGTHVSVFVQLMRGEFDDHLKWPFNGRITVQLKTEKKLSLPLSKNVFDIDEDVRDKYVRKPTERNKAWGFPEYICHRDLCAGGYLKTNKLFFCVSKIVIK